MNTEQLNKTGIIQDEISIKDLISKLRITINYLMSKWALILSFVILGAGLGFLYAYFKKPIFTATTTFVLEEDKAGGGGLGSIAGLASMAGIDLSSGGGGIFQGDNILQLYKSRSMIEKTLLTSINYEGKKELLIDRYIDFNGLREKWAKYPELKEIRFSEMKSSDEIEDRKFSRLQDSVIGVIVENINKTYLNVIKPEKKLSIIKAQVSSEDEFFAKSFNEQIVKNVNDFYVQTKTKRSLENVLILQQKVDSVRSVMNGAIYKAAAVSDATPNLNPTRQVTRTAPIQQSQFSAETNKIMLGELVKNLELSKISLRKETPLIQVVDLPIYPLDKEVLGVVKFSLIGGIIGCILIIFFLLIGRVMRGLIM